MSVETVESDVVAHLAAEVASLTANQNVRRGPQMPASQNQSVPGAVPEECVFVLLTGGPKSVVFNGSEPSDSDPTIFKGEDYPTVQVWIRSFPKDYDGGRNLALSVLRAIDRKPPSGYFEAEVFGSAPDFIREDDENRYEWSINATLKICR